jgi:multidrug efflux pump subunit AcrA (membrane-fusion protein)
MLLIVSVLALILSGCSKEETIKPEEKVRQVSVVTVNKETHKETISYTGFVSARQILPLSFGFDGIVGDVKVSEGQKVKSGDLLMSLKNNSDPSASIYAGIDGIIAEVINRSGDVIGAGYPVVILRTAEQIVQIGVTDNDLIRIEKFGDPVVKVDLDSKIIEAKLDDINKLPDEMSRTYTVTVALDDKLDYLIGKLCTVSFELARQSGMWLPINHIQNDGEDYVYIVTSENRVERKNLKLKEINNELVRVEGLEEGNRIITIGNSFVKEGQQVEAREASNE